ncbi:MAG: carbohydrate kinase family protein [Candidatus Liptonbacteria bacterium]|nr:carbohydrate kinase family protein [Candidatus Liptonbacteria bacterium]
MSQRSTRRRNADINPTSLPSKRFDVIGLGLNSVDTIFTLDKHPRWGQKTEIRGSQLLSGGQVSTAMVGVQRLGKAALYIGKIGGDPQGITLHTALEKEGVNCENLMIQETARTQSAIITVHSRTGERTVLWEHDELLHIKPTDLSRAVVTSGKILHIDGCDTQAAIQAARWANESDVIVTADFDTKYRYLDQLIPLVHFPILSEQLAGELTSLWPGPEKKGKRREDWELTALEQIALDFDLSFIAVTLGERGVLALDCGQPIRVPGFNLKEMAKPEAYQLWEYDTIGAGDAFRTGFIYALFNEAWNLEEKLRVANAVAALNCLKRGAWAGLPTKEQLFEFLQRNSVFDMRVST